MVSKAFQIVIDKLNVYLKNQFNYEEDMVGIVYPNQNNELAFNNHLIGVLLLTTTKETVKPFYGGQNQEGNLSVTSHNQTRNINAEILFTIAPSQSIEFYTMGINVLDVISNYFDSFSIYDHKNTPELTEINKISVESTNVALSTLEQITTITKHTLFPCTMYTLRILGISIGVISNTSTK